MPGIASKVWPAEARAIQAFHAFSTGRVRISELARRFHRTRATIRAVLRDPAYQAYLAPTARGRCGGEPAMQESLAITSVPAPPPAVSRNFKS
jgi:hypothetical protein